MGCLSPVRGSAGRGTTICVAFAASPRIQAFVLRQADSGGVKPGRESLGVRGLMFEAASSAELDTVESRLVEQDASGRRSRSDSWEVVTGYDPDRLEVAFGASLTGSPIPAAHWRDLSAMIYTFGD